MKTSLVSLYCVLLYGVSAASIKSTRVKVSLSGNFSHPELPAMSCNLPDVINLTITAGDVITSLEVSKTQRVTQNAPVYVIGDDGQVRPLANEDKETYALYQDLNTGSAVMVTCPTPESQDQKPTVEGTVTCEGHKFHLRHSSRRRRDVSSLTSDSEEYQLTEVPEDPVKGHVIDYVLPPDVHSLPKLSPTSSPGQEQADPTVDDIVRHRLRRQASAMQNVYIDITVVIAYDIYQSYYKDSAGTTEVQRHTNTLEGIRKHYALLMSEVDMYYRMIGSRLPYKISIGLASFVIAQNAASSKWTEDRRNLSSASDRYIVDAYSALSALESWIRSSSSLPPMDYYLLFTGYDLSYSEASVGSLGLAYIGGVCASSESVTLDRGRNCAVVEDDKRYFSQTVDVTAHEIGHGLGAQHDGYNNYCLASANYTMTPTLPGSDAANYGIFSPCSLSYFSSTFSLLSTSPQSESCIHKITSPAGVPNVTGLVPGQVYDVQTQCKRAFGNASYVCQGITFLGDSMCVRTYCSLRLNSTVCSAIALARGSSCGHKKWCDRASCVESPDALPMDASRPFGDRVRSDVNMTCDQHVATFNGYCYDVSIANRCASCASVRSASASCPFGDKVQIFTDVNMTCPQFVATHNGYCYVASIADSCCASCASVRSASASCPFGDRVRLFTDVNMTCPQYVATFNGYCYDASIADSCCASCASVRSASGCEFGDQASDCQRFHCLEWRYRQFCCDTCSASIRTSLTTIATTTRTTKTSSVRPMQTTKRLVVGRGSAGALVASVKVVSISVACALLRALIQ